MRRATAMVLVAACSGSGGGGQTGSEVDAAPPGPPSKIGDCEVFPPSDPWKLDVSNAQVDSGWTTKLLAHATKTQLHPDFGGGYGLPINVVPQGQAGVAITFDYTDESDPGLYPFPPTVRVEGGTATSCDGDCHVLVVQQGVCLLWEAWACSYGGSSWSCGSGAKFDLTRSSAGQRPKGWTSADAAGLAITPGLAREAEAAAGSINHAIRFTMHCTQDGFVAPASHQAVPTGRDGCPAGITSDMLRAEYPPMGTRVRLKRGYATASMPTRARAIAEAMKTYGMILADNGSDWFFQGEDSPGWTDADLDALKAIPADQLEVLSMPAIER